MKRRNIWFWGIGMLLLIFGTRVTAQATKHPWQYSPSTPMIYSDYQILIPQQLSETEQQAYQVVEEFLKRIQNRTSVKEMLVPHFDVVVQNQILDHEQLFLSRQRHYLIKIHWTSSQEIEFSLILMGRPNGKKAVLYMQRDQGWKVVDLILTDITQ